MNCPVCELFHSKFVNIEEEDLVSQATHLKECDEGYDKCKKFIYRFGIDMWDIPANKRKKFKETIDSKSKTENINLWYETLRRILILDDPHYEEKSGNMDSRENFVDEWNKKME